jgi:uncharacterized membrane protein
MAGIGLRLEELFEKDTFTSDAIAHTVAGFVLSGAWVFGIAAIVLTFLASASHLSRMDQAIMFTMITYSNAMAMILTSILTLPTSRYLADALYAGEVETIGPTFVASSVFHMVVGGLMGAAFYAINPLPPVLKLLGTLLTIASTQLWHACAYVNLLRSYVVVVTTFMVGYTLATLGSIRLGEYYGVTGYLFGFLCGLSLIAVMLTAYLQIKLRFSRPLSFKFLRYCIEKPSLMVVGFCMAAGCWVDKAILWYGAKNAIHATPYLRSYPVYDVAFFLGYIASLPALSRILMTVETTFARNVRYLYTGLGRRDTYDRIHADKVELVEGLNADFWGLVRVQAPITLMVLYFAPNILSLLTLPPPPLHIFRLSALAGAGVTLLQSQVLYLLYFDLSAWAVFPSLVYVVANGALTYVTLVAGYWSYGLGNLVAVYAALALGILILNRNLGKLERIALVHFAKLSLGRKARNEPASMPIAVESVAAGMSSRVGTSPGV